MPWSHPAARMREYILAMRAIWAAWNDGEKLDFRGDFYQHTLMTPFFAPPPNKYGAPKVFLAAVGELMTEVAGEVADGIIIHGFTTERYVKEVTLPAIERGLAKSRSGAHVVRDLGAVVRRHRHATRKSWPRRGKGTQQQIAFYGSTPAYRGVLELHGWGDLQTELNTLSKQGEWVQMGELIDDDILNTFAVVAEPEGVGRRADAPVRRRRRPLLVLRAVRGRSRALGRGDRRPQTRVGGASVSAANFSIDAIVVSGSCCGPKWPRCVMTSSDPWGSWATICSPNLGEMSVLVSPHTTRTGDWISGSRPNAPWVGAIA